MRVTALLKDKIKDFIFQKGGVLFRRSGICTGINLFLEMEKACQR